jgi:hypothetical protein
MQISQSREQYVRWLIATKDLSPHTIRRRHDQTERAACQLRDPGEIAPPPSRTRPRASEEEAQPLASEVGSGPDADATPSSLP